MPPTQTAWRALPVAMIPMLGCATYEPQPLELDRYIERWSARDLDAEPVRAYAETLAGEAGCGRIPSPRVSELAGVQTDKQIQQDQTQHGDAKALPYEAHPHFRS